MNTGTGCAKGGFPDCPTPGELYCKDGTKLDPLQADDGDPRGREGRKAEGCESLQEVAGGDGDTTEKGQGRRGSNGALPKPESRRRRRAGRR